MRTPPNTPAGRALRDSIRTYEAARDALYSAAEVFTMEQVEAMAAKRPGAVIRASCGNGMVDLEVIAGGKRRSLYDFPRPKSPPWLAFLEEYGDRHCVAMVPEMVEAGPR